ncbi:UNVERIFIED_CONTAM: hypothetical protein Sradi_6195600 [Sesamum radiatum]|uniref:Uncharacterized protein n=1 Tax=Sesamum radiatum TaxID=300843 RepID=A0AAW2K8K2_SESRA
MLGTIQEIISVTILEQVAALAPVRVATPPDADAPEEEPKGETPVPIPPVDRGLSHQLLKRFLHNGLPALNAFKKASRTSSIRLEEPPKRKRKVSPSPKL